MKRIARFEKVSFGQFSDGWDDTFQAIEKGENKDQSKETLKEIYDRIKLPRRATAGSAGYDFFADPIGLENPTGSVSEDIFNRGLCLPSDIKNTKEDMELIINTIRRMF